MASIGIPGQKDGSGCHGAALDAARWVHCGSETAVAMSGEVYAHEILGIPPRATASEIRQAYRRLARVYHPDRNASAEAAEMFKAVKAAHDAMLAALESGGPSYSESPSLSQSRPSAHRTTSRAAQRTTRAPDVGPRWRGPGSGEPGPAWARTGATTRRRSSSWQSDPRVVIAEPPDLDDLTAPFEVRDLYRSSFPFVAMLVWFVMFFGFLLTLKAWQRQSVPDDPPASEELAEDDVEDEDEESARRRRR